MQLSTGDIVKTGWTKIKVRYDITWDGESESYIYWDPDGNLHSFRELFDGIFGENSNCIRNVKKNMELRCR